MTDNTMERWIEDTVTRWCYEHDCYEHPDNPAPSCSHATPWDHDDCSFVMIPLADVLGDRTLWHVHYRCGCWSFHLRKPARKEPMTCPDHGPTKAMTAFIYEPEEDERPSAEVDTTERLDSDAGPCQSCWGTGCRLGPDGCNGQQHAFIGCSTCIACKGTGLAAKEADRGEAVEDGFGGCWLRCDDPRCDLEVVRPGKIQCSDFCASGFGSRFRT